MLLLLTKKTELDMSQVVETAGADCVFQGFPWVLIPEPASQGGGSFPGL